MVVNWTFWSFYLTGKSTGGEMNASDYFAEVIFGLPFPMLLGYVEPGSSGPPFRPPRFVPGPPIPNPAAPTQTVTTPLNNSNIVGVSAGYVGGFECNGTDYQLQTLAGPVTNTPVVVNTHISPNYGNTTVTVHNGVVKLVDLGIAFSPMNASTSLPLLALGASNRYPQVDFGPQYFCTGTWTLKNIWAEYTDSLTTYSISNPPYPPPAFPPGGEFPQ